jgi:E3 ubiquitin-protein ligase HECTD2
MAPWPNRYGSQPADDLVARLHITDFNAPPGSLGRVTNLPILDNAQDQADSSSSESDIHPSRPKRPQHARSMSHPFPALFSSKKKKQDKAGRDLEDSDSTENEARMTKQQGKSHKRGDANGSQDFATGNCMTCASLVRWPKDVNVFKCTICLTVNDLQPHDPEVKWPGDRNRFRGTSGSAESPDKLSQHQGKESRCIPPV